MSDEEWLDYYIELNSSFSNIDYTKVYEELQRNKDMEQQMQQFQQQQLQQQMDLQFMENVNNNMFP